MPTGNNLLTGISLGITVNRPQGFHSGGSPAPIPISGRVLPLFRGAARIGHLWASHGVNGEKKYHNVAAATEHDPMLVCAGFACPCKRHKYKVVRQPLLRCCNGPCFANH